MSLGVDLVPKKVCSLNCVYCEAGKTTSLTTEQAEYIPYAAIKDELIDYFTSNNPDPDCITFSGAGEPTLHSQVKAIIELIRSYRPNISIAMITNGTLLTQPQVREALLATDIVLPSLDAVTDRVFRRINRPERHIDLAACIQGLIDFRKVYSGKMYLEVFIIPGYNDDEAHLLKMSQILKEVNADQVQINTLDRPGAVSRIRAASPDELQRVVDILDLPNIQIISKVQPHTQAVAYRQDAESAIFETIRRRPCTVDDLSTILGLHIDDIMHYIETLKTQNKVEGMALERGYFYKGL
ncbi:radical SAM protein [Celerinatantimonas sp. YJH-8]|uniref:radical SAM protein n=1 Tax=Celerinatantimonas sp. YJH-8 TaxID=3228714 RepID=UPI0038C18CBE